MHKADLVHDNLSLQQKLEQIFVLRKSSRVNWDQAGYFALLERLGNPQNNVPPVLHVAGTNGKGSMVALLRAVLEAAGYKVHAYTSPHLLRVNERIYLAGQEISDSYLEHLIDEVLAFEESRNLSFFEIMTALAFKAFRDVSADVLLLETGMGGRLDCTNVVEKPLATLISRVSMDHMEFLGDTLEGIAAEKAGIIKAGVPCVAGYQGDGDAVVSRILIEAAQEKAAPLSLFGRDWRIAPDGSGGLRFSFDGEEHLWPWPGLEGVHQMYNAGAVLTALDLVKDVLPVSEKSMRKGFAAVSWPGRLQRFPAEAAGMPEDCVLWLDCGHNDSAGLALAAQAKLWAVGSDPRPLHLVLGMLGRKDVRAFLEPLWPFLASVRHVPISFEPSCLSAQAFEEIVRGFSSDQAGIYTGSFDSLQAALQDVVQDHAGPCRVLVAGSVYLAGDFMRLVQGDGNTGG
ncbi:MAG: bifunctional folylpolyglutamate synthase/dihydrofolate synthase [Alphaproteobacteria bacterium]|nr:bifunctional folylpolyglutamate synthase/dihydrofolate synthase [Alphaproteobacteria bacterium]